MDEKEWMAEEEPSLIFTLIEREDVLGKKVKIYSRLLTDPALAKAMEGLALRHEKRKEDLIRIESERKEEERKKNIPYIRLSYNKDLPPLVANANMRYGLDFENTDELDRLDNKTFYQINIKDFVIKNLSRTNIILNGVIAYEKYFEFSRVEIVEPDACCLVKTTNNSMFSVSYPEQSIWLVLSDTLGNQYKTECHLSLETGTDRWRMITTIAGEEYTGIDFPYKVDSIELPTLITK